MEALSRVLLIEIINTDQFPGQIREKLPLVKGILRYLGMESRWIRFGKATDHLYVERNDAIVLSQEERLTLAEHLEQLKPELMLVTHRLEADVEQLVREVVGDIPLVRFDEAIPQLFRLLGRRVELQLEDLVMVQNQPGFRLDYVWIPGNDAALRKDRNNVYLVTSQGCGYHRRVNENPFFRDVPLPSKLLGGCSFCGARDEGCDQAYRAAGDQGLPVWTPSQWIREQIREVAATLTGDRTPNALILTDVERPEILEVALQTMRETGLNRKTGLLLGLRVDRLLQVEGFLRTVLSDTVGGVQATLQLFSMGLENFSGTELGRLNKGTTPWMNLRAANVLKDFETKYPGRFYYSGYGGLSMILLTPWTTLSDLHLNVGLVRHLGMENEIGNLFVSRLRLHPNLAITHLAQHDGVVIAQEDDEVLILNRRKLFAEELPWKHQEPRLGPVSRIAVRLGPERDLEGDDLYKEANRAMDELRRHARGRIRGWTGRPLEVRFLEAVVEAAVASSEPRPESELLESATRKLLEQLAPVVDRLPRLGEAKMPWDAALERLSRLVRSGLKPVLCLPVPQGAMPSIESVLEGLSHTLVNLPRVDGGSEPTLVVAQSQPLLDEFLDLTWREARQEDPERRGRLSQRLGRMLGYPACCVEAWSQEPRSHVGLVSWGTMQRRWSRPQNTSMLVPPTVLGAAGFIPCSSNCAQAQETTKRWAEEMSIELPNEGETSLAFLFPLSTELPEEMVSIRVLTHGSGELTYDPGRIGDGDGAIRHALRSGDRLVFVPGQVGVYRGWELKALWTATVAVWFAKDTFDAAEWLELAVAALRNADPQARKAAATAIFLARRFLADSRITHRI